MLKLEDIRKDVQVRGIEPDEIVRIVTVEPVGDDAITVYYKNSQGRLGEQMLFRSDEARLELAEVGRAWAFDASGADFKLGLEAYRISLAHLFDPMMAVHTSNVDPYPHQISAVYEAMLPRQPLRFVLADDPGAGKTIMAGLLIRELMMRADAKRILIVAPGSLCEQWQDELLEKFGTVFGIFSREKQEQCASGNYFDEQNLLIARLDQLSRSDDLKELLQATEWDLIVVDEAHKLSANYFGNKVNKTKRFLLGEMLGSITRHFLLMTATPHNGKEEDFQIWLSLLDSDRFYGKFREGAHKVDVTDMMRRMVKEDMRKFDGTLLFPERRAYTANYKLSDLEAALYADVTDYVRHEMNRADNLEGKRKGTVGFALTLLQRRLASSPEAIYQSLKRRRERLENRLREMQLIDRGHQLAETLGEYVVTKQLDLPDSIDDLEDELSSEEYEAYVDQVVDQATASATIPELEAEIISLQDLETKALTVVRSGNDRKWEELSSLLQDTPEMFNAVSGRRKLIIFTEHRDTLNYLIERIRGLMGAPEAVRADQFRSKQDLLSALEKNFEAIAVASDRIANILEKIVDKCYRHAVTTYTGRQSFLANCNDEEGPAFPAEICPQMLTGPAGIGKSTLVKRLIDVLPEPSSIAVEAGYSKFPLTSIWSLSIRRNRAPRDMLRKLIISNGGTPSGRTIDDLVRQCRCMAYQSGTCMLAVDEVQFAAKSQSASAAIVNLLFLLADIGIPVLYVANYSLGHKLYGRNQEERDRFLSQPHILLPDTVDDKDWHRTIAGFTALAPEILKINPQSDAARLHSYTAGSKRLLATLFRIAIDRANYSQMEVTIDGIKRAFESTDLSAHRDDVSGMRLQFVTGKKHKKDLWCPFEIPATQQQEQARAADEFNKQEMAESAIENSLSQGERDLLHELRESAAARDPGNVVPIGSKSAPSLEDFARGAEILKDL